MPWKAEITQDGKQEEYPDVIEVLIGHFNLHNKDAARVYLETRAESVQKEIRPDDSVTLTWKPEETR